MSTLVMKTKNYFSDWTLFEISWLIISTLTMLTLSIILGRFTDGTDQWGNRYYFGCSLC